MIIKGEMKALPHNFTLALGVFTWGMAVLHFYHQWKKSNGRNTQADQMDS